MKKGTKKLLACLMCAALAVSPVFAVACNGTNSGINSGMEQGSATSITVSSANNATELDVGKTLQLTAKVSPESASQKVIWSSSDESKATVSADGVVTAIAAGNVMITAKSESNASVKKDFALVINASTAVVAPTAITLAAAGNATELKVGATLKINASVTPAEALQEVVWSTSDASIATVANGVVTGVKEGSVTITATAKNVDTVKNTITLTVVAASTPTPTVDYSALPYSTHAEYMAMENDKSLKVKGVVTYIASNKDNKISYYLQNGDDAFYAYQQDAALGTVEVGKVYEVGGVKTYYRTGAHEIKSIDRFVELNETITANKINIDDKKPSDKTAMMAYHGAVVTGTATIKAAPAVSTSAYSVSVTTKDGGTTTLRVDAGNMAESEVAAINAKFATAIAGVEVTFTGVMTHFGNGTPLPQILIYKASEITVAEPTAADKVRLVKDAITIDGFVKADATVITLPTTSTAFNDVAISWSSANTAIIANDGAVTHPAKDTIVTLTATIAHKTDATATDTKQIKVNVAGSSFNAEKLAELNFEDALPAKQYGMSETKSGYETKDGSGAVTDAANTVTLGGKAWILTGTAIAGDAGDHRDGTFAGRMSARGSKVETTVAGEYNYVQFNIATFGSQAHGTKVSVAYKLADGTEWVESGIIITVSSYTLSTIRVALPEGAKQVKIYVVANSGSGNLNIDGIELYK